MRTTSLHFRESINAAQTGEVPVFLFTIDHADLPSPLLLSTDNLDTFEFGGQTVRGTISNGSNYVFLPMEITLPDDNDEGIASASITIENVSREILAFFRSITSAPSIDIKLVLASTPDTVEMSHPNFEFDSVQGDVVSVTGVLSLGHFLSEPFPAGTMGPHNFPGYF